MFRQGRAEPSAKKRPERSRSGPIHLDLIETIRLPAELLPGTHLPALADDVIAAAGMRQGTSRQGRAG
jgi:hypothetical protein